jgi:hypothetical protein
VAEFQAGEFLVDQRVAIFEEPDSSSRKRIAPPRTRVCVDAKVPDKNGVGFWWRVRESGDEPGGVGFIMDSTQGRFVGPETSTGEPAPDAAPPADLPFSWGAAGISFWWLVFHGKGRMALLILLLNVVLAALTFAAGPVGFAVSLLVSVCVMGWLGVVGSGIAFVYKGCATEQELRRKERVWTVLGILVMCLMVVQVIRTVAVMERSY